MYELLSEICKSIYVWQPCTLYVEMDEEPVEKTIKIAAASDGIYVVKEGVNGELKFCEFVYSSLNWGAMPTQARPSNGENGTGLLAVDPRFNVPIPRRRRRR